MDPDRWAQIEHLFHAAMELEPDKREAFVARACAGDELTERQVLALLRSDNAAVNFIEEPALPVAASSLSGQQSEAPPMSAPPTMIGGYQVLAPLGRGGMGEVYLAEDPRLGRKVAIKLLPSEFTSNTGRVRRFTQEARAASSLNHPNIVTIYEIGEAAIESLTENSTGSASTHYIVTEYVEGKTLRQRLKEAAGERLFHAESVDVAVQIAAALSAAHEAGIVHRDIKPENVMLRRDGLVKVLDFGLAKLTEPLVTGNAPENMIDSTDSGLVMGTPRYMSPEQARGEKVDGRSDVFSLGVLLYEMIAGHPPFVGATLSEVIAAILRDNPTPLATHAPEVPQELERIVGRTLEKNRSDRYESAGALLNDLRDLQQVLLTAKSGSKASIAASSRRTRQSRLGLPVAVAVVIAAIASGWIYFKPSPILTSKDAILLADIDNKTGEEAFDGALKQGIAMRLEQSPFLKLVAEGEIQHELKLMKRSPNERVTAQTAREICQRLNLKALITGSIASFGSNYVVTLEAINAQTGETFAREQAEAQGKEQVLTALSKAASELRERVNESLSSIHHSDHQIQESTTSNLEALKAYSLGFNLAINGQLNEAIPFLQRAVEIDPDFAQAQMTLAFMLVLVDRNDRAIEVATKAFALKDRVGEVEKLRITHAYHLIVTGNVSKVIEQLKLQKGTYPQKFTGSLDLAVAYGELGAWDQSLTEAREAHRQNPNFAGAYTQLARALIRLNRFEEAKSVLVEARQHHVESMHHRPLLYEIAFINSDAAGIQEYLDWARTNWEEFRAFEWQARAAAFSGNWRQAKEMSRRAFELAAAHADKEEIAGRLATEQALRGAALGDCGRSRADVAEGLKLSRGRVSLTRAALALALCNEPNRAEELAGEMAKLFPEDTLVQSVWLPSIQAATELQRGSAVRGIEVLRQASPYEAAAKFWPQYVRGLSYLKLGQGAKAGAEFQKIIDHRGEDPLSALYPIAHLGSARANALTSDASESRHAYEAFFALWKSADSDLPFLKAARKEYDRLRP